MARWLRHLRRLFVVGLFGGAVYASGGVDAPRTALSPRVGLAITDARSWGYQLQGASPDRMAAAIDLLVVDAQREAAPHESLGSDTVARFQQRPDGSRRLVLAYLSIGEAETYRHYWWPHWRWFAPSWLGPENREWKNNHLVRFWQPGWRRIIVDPRPSLAARALEQVSPARKPYLDRVLEAGFDGVYLDRVDAYYEWQKSNPGAEAAMIAFVAEISAYAKARKPNFLIVPQNAEELLQHAHYRRHIDAVAKEDLFFGAKEQEQVNSAEDVAESVRYLNQAKAAQRPVFLVEYLTRPEARAQAEAMARSKGYVLHFAGRALNQAPVPLSASETGRPREAAPVLRPKG
jgi:cysteinyl-tRNA synthetase, unknown class